MSKQPKNASSLAVVRQGMRPKQLAAFDRLQPQCKLKACMVHRDDIIWMGEQSAKADQRAELIGTRRGLLTANARFNLDCGNGLKPTRNDLAEYQQRIADIKELTAEIAETTEQMPPRFSYEAVLDFLEDNSRSVFPHHREVFDGTITLAAIAKNHEKINAKKIERKRIVGANYTLEEGEAMIDAVVRNEGSDGGIKIESVLRNHQTLHGYRQGRPVLSSNPNGSISGDRALAIMFDLFGPEIAAKLKDRVRVGFDPETAINASERKTQLAKVDAELLRLEHIDEAMFLAARRAGLNVSRRESANIAAVLEIDPDTNAAQAVAPAVGRTLGGLAVAIAGDPHEDDEDFG